MRCRGRSGLRKLFWNGKLIGGAGRIDQNDNLLEGDSRLLAFHVLAEDVQAENEVRIKVRGMGAMGGLLGLRLPARRRRHRRALSCATFWGAVPPALVGFLGHFFKFSGAVSRARF